MKVTVKTTQQKVFQVSFSTYSIFSSLIAVQVEVEGTDTVGTIKQKIEKDHGHAVSAQKIIYSGVCST